MRDSSFWASLDCDALAGRLSKTTWVCHLGVPSRSRWGSLVSIVFVDFSAAFLFMRASCGSGGADTSCDFASTGRTVPPRGRRRLLPFWSNVTGLLVGVDLPVRIREPCMQLQGTT